MQFKIETITPATAAKYLLTNTQEQRHISQAHVDRLVQSMTTGEFDGLNGQTIKFNGSAKKPTLVDGQHRLTAIVQSKRTQKMAVLRGVSENAFKTIDNDQASRTVENYYQIHNQEHAKVAAQVARWTYRVETFGGRILRPEKKAPGHLAAWALKNHGDIPSVLDGADRHLTAFARAKLGTKSHLAFCYYHWYQKDPALAHDVLQYLGSNVGDVPTIFQHCKQYLMEEAARTQAQTVRGNERLGLVLSAMWAAWNSHRKGERIQMRGLKQRMRLVYDPDKQSSDTIQLPKCL